MDLGNLQYRSCRISCRQTYYNTLDCRKIPIYQWAYSQQRTRSVMLDHDRKQIELNNPNNFTYYARVSRSTS